MKDIDKNVELSLEDLEKVSGGLTFSELSTILKKWIPEIKKIRDTQGAAEAKKKVIALLPAAAPLASQWIKTL